ncbi:MAG TPA: glycosyltransferase family 4 protein [Anaerolineales bacterium]|nr:glycosyltransferase family 4 protein [Anaerolineales bacterium]
METNVLPDLKRVAFIGNHLPRQCGIATFTTDLSDSFSARYPGVQTMVLAMNDRPEGYAYPTKVRYELREGNLFDYERAANFLNQHAVDAISLQHEFGIFGGKWGRNILTLLRNVNAPVVTTLHTVLEKPDPEQYEILQEVARLSNRLVVMSEHSSRDLQNIYGVPEHKIDFIPHGIHDVPFVDPGFHKDKFGAEGRFVLMTFGLLSRNKGLEYVIEALPAVVQRYPNLTYLILGATHPHVVAYEGESYRESLQERVRELGLEKNVLFLDQFVDLKDLKEFIGAVDIYITPYLDPEQVVSGTLAYTVGAGKAVISTPYRYAKELLNEGRGMLVPFRDSNAITEKILYLMENEAERDAIRKKAYLYGRNMIWPVVAERYLETFDKARRQHFVEHYLMTVNNFLEDEAEEAPVLKLDHIERLTDETGMFQHAVFSVPNYNEGYTTDDNARALIVSVQLEEVNSVSMNEAEQAALARVQELGHRYLAFLWHAFNPEKKRFRNFMSYDRRWLEEVGSEDSHGRALWALGTVLAHSKRDGLQQMAGRLFEAALPAVADLVSPRAWAFALMGIDRYLSRYPGDRAVLMIQASLVQNLLRLYRENHTSAWKWFEDIATYCNPALPQALLRYAQTNEDPEAMTIGLESLEWLVSIQRSEKGWIMPIGNQGFYEKDGPISYFDQQPVEVYSLLSACLDACRATRDRKWYEYATQAFEWFFGRNALGVAVYDKVTGGCRDGLHVDRLNENQGAESTLSFLQSLLEMQKFERENTRQYQNNGNRALPSTFLKSERAGD